MPALIFKKGLDLKHEVAGVLAESYHWELVAASRNKTTASPGRLTVFLAREFGFCYGVDRAVDYAYQAGAGFPTARVFLTGEIIHNPHVNDQLRAQGIRFLSDPGEDGRPSRRTTLWSCRRSASRSTMLQRLDRSAAPSSTPPAARS